MTLAWTNPNYRLTRALFQRGLGIVYLIAFLNAVNEFKPLLGENGLLPAPAWMRTVPFAESPSLFYLAPKDGAFTIAAWLGVVLSCAAIAGIAERVSSLASAALWALLWVLYLSFVNVGQTFYAFGWESILLEAGFYAIFLGSRKSAPQMAAIVMLRWLCFRVMFGAGLIKLHSDSCWHDATCLDYYYQTQPMPNPLSWYFHWAPEWTHHAGVWFNHFSELIVPFAYFLPQPVASAAGILTIVFQSLIMTSGNLCWLNLLTIVLAIPALDDRVLGLVFRRPRPEVGSPALAHKIAVGLLAVLVAVMSLNPIGNMLSAHPFMNMDYNPLRLVGTYGAFGSITRERYEVVVEGTADSDPGPAANWREYQFRGKPTAVGRRPPQIAPYHLRLDWLMWFAAMGSYSEQPWFIHFMGKLLSGDRDTLSLLAYNPFPGSPPKYVRAELYLYRFASREERKRTGAWWTRQYSAPYFPAISLQSEGLQEIYRQQGWR